MAGYLRIPQEAKRTFWLFVDFSRFCVKFYVNRVTENDRCAVYSYRLIRRFQPHDESANVDEWMFSINLSGNGYNEVHCTN